MPGYQGAPQTTFANPRWAKDYLNREHVIAGGSKVDPALFPRDNAVSVTVGAAGAAAGATSIPVAALAGPIPAGSTLRFNTGALAYVTVAALTGAVTITVDPLGFALVSGNTSQYLGTGRAFIANGTVVGRTLAERDAGTPFGPAADADTEVRALVHDIFDAYANNDATLYRPGSMLDEAHLPGFAALSAAIKATLRSTYQCMRGAD